MMRSTLQLIKAACCLLLAIVLIEKSHGQSGSFDTSFGNGGIVKDTVSFYAAYPKICVQKDGKIVYGYISHNKLPIGADYTVIFKRLNADGSIDSSFGNNGTQNIITPHILYGIEYSFCMSIDKKDRIVFATLTETPNSDSSLKDQNFLVSRITKNGNLDSTFGISGVLTIDFTNDPSYYTHRSYPSSIIMTKDQKIYVTGTYMPRKRKRDGDYFCIPIAKLNVNGSFDSSFGVNGKILMPLDHAKMYPDHILSQKDGKIIIGSYYMRQSNYKPFNWGIYRFNLDGSLDSSFGNGGRLLTYFPGYASVRGMTLLNNQIILCGDGYYDDIGQTNQMMEKYRANGSIVRPFEKKMRTTFPGKSLRLVQVSSNDKIIALDYAQSLLKFHADGTPDSSFGINGVANIFFADYYQYSDMVLQTDNKILVASFDSNGKFGAIARYNNSDSTSNLLSSSSIALQKKQEILLRLSPNPASNYILLTGMKENLAAKILITDVSGKTLKIVESNQATEKIDIQNLRSGTYYVTIFQNGEVVKQTFLKK